MLQERRFKYCCRLCTQVNQTLLVLPAKLHMLHLRTTLLLTL